MLKINYTFYIKKLHNLNHLNLENNNLLNDPNFW